MPSLITTTTLLLIVERWIQSPSQRVETGSPWIARLATPRRNTRTGTTWLLIAESRLHGWSVSISMPLGCFVVGWRVMRSIWIISLQPDHRPLPIGIFFLRSVVGRRIRRTSWNISLQPDSLILPIVNFFSRLLVGRRRKEKLLLTGAS